MSIETDLQDIKSKLETLTKSIQEREKTIKTTGDTKTEELLTTVRKSVKHSAKLISQRLAEEGGGAETRSSGILPLLGQALALEFEGIFMLSRDASEFTDESVAKDLKRIEAEEVKHVDKVANLIKELGGEPVYSYASHPQEVTALKRLQGHFQREKKSIELYETCINMVAATNAIKTTLQEVHRDEKRHHDIVEKLIQTHTHALL